MMELASTHLNQASAEYFNKNSIESGQQLANLDNFAGRVISNVQNLEEDQNIMLFGNSCSRSSKIKIVTNLMT